MYFDLWKKSHSFKKCLPSACCTSCPLQGTYRLSESMLQYTETEGDQRACFTSFFWQNILLPPCYTDMRHPRWFLLKIPSGKQHLATSTFGFPFSPFKISAFLLPVSPSHQSFTLWSEVLEWGCWVPDVGQAVFLMLASLTSFKSLQLLSLSLRLLSWILPFSMISPPHFSS